MSTTHDLKTWPEPFTAIIEGRKTHEIRRADRPFAVGDTLHLHEWDPHQVRQFRTPHGIDCTIVDANPRGYTNRSIKVLVTYLTSGGQWGLPDDLCVMSIEVTP